MKFVGKRLKYSLKWPILFLLTLSQATYSGTVIGNVLLLVFLNGANSVIYLLNTYTTSFVKALRVAWEHQLCDTHSQCYYLYSRGPCYETVYVTLERPIFQSPENLDIFNFPNIPKQSPHSAFLTLFLREYSIALKNANGAATPAGENIAVKIATTHL